MTSRRIALAAVVAALATVTVGCGDEPSSQGAAHVESNVAHTRATDAESADGSVIVRHVASELYGPIAKAAGDANLAYSPLSITTALGMTRAGAKGTSATQLDGFLAASTTDDLHRAINGASESMTSAEGPVKLDSGEMGSIELSDANALWGQSGVTWKAPFLDELKGSYDASMWTADFANDPERARSEINDWVAEHTGEHITELLPKGSINDATRLTLTNALFFKAPWPERFDQSEKTKPFTRPDGSQVRTKMLDASGTRRFQDGAGWKAVTLPYAGKKLAMTLLVPDKGKLHQVESALDDELLATVLTGGTDANMNLAFPPFDIDSRSGIGDVLKGLGVTAPFNTDTDFEPMTTDSGAQPLHLADVLHEATVTVDENGTEASAATAATFEQVGAMISDQQLTVDRPFLFIIHDLATSTPLFIGRITDPTAG